MRDRLRIVAMLAALFLLSACARKETAVTDPKYACSSAEDCTSTCGAGCVSKDWAAGYRDPCVNVRAFDCSCVQGICYTDGRAP